MIADASGRAVAFSLAPDQAHELLQAIDLLVRLPHVPRWVAANRGTTSHAFREHIWNLGAKPAIPPQRHEASVTCPAWITNNRNRVERLWARLNEWRAIATRHVRAAMRIKTSHSFMSVLCFAAALDWLKS